MPGTVLYFAFGSNMLSKRLERRCSSARVRALAAAPGYEVAFDKLSEDTSGKANLVRGRSRQATCADSMRSKGPVIGVGNDSR